MITSYTQDITFQLQSHFFFIIIESTWWQNEMTIRNIGSHLTMTIELVSKWDIQIYEIPAPIPNRFKSTEARVWIWNYDRHLYKFTSKEAFLGPLDEHECNFGQSHMLVNVNERPGFFWRIMTGPSWRFVN